MKFRYQFSNLVGTVYRKGNLIFSPDGNSVLAPVGNRITIYDLKNNKTSTLPAESRFNITTLELSPDGNILLAVNEQGEAFLISMISRRVVHTYFFKRPICCIRFSPDNKRFAVTKEGKAFVFKSPGPYTGEYNPFVLDHVFTGFTDDTTCIDWSYNSKFVAVGSRDMTVRLYSLEKYSNFRICILGSHTDCIVACYFEKNSLDMITIAKNGIMCLWECSIDPENLVPLEPAKKKKKKDVKEDDGEDDMTENKDENEKEKEEEPFEVFTSSDKEDSVAATEGGDKMYYRRLQRQELFSLVREKGSKQFVTLTSAAYHKDIRILVTGFSNGSFLIHEMPDINLIHSLSISEHGISSIALNNTGDWIALGCSDLGQLLVWEWQSETYIMKQQGHYNNMSCLKYSPSGQYIVTGSHDGKVKLWNSVTGFCFVTFHEHTANVASVEFSHNGKFVVSASYDGTVRAFDMARYRNFRTFMTPRPVQFACLAIDSSSEFIAAGGQDVFEIYLWSMKIGKLVEILVGHEGPVVSISFNPALLSTSLASVSWDKTLKIWNAVETGSDHETIQLTSDGLFVTFSPNGQEIAVATLDGQITFFDSKTSDQKACIEGRSDLGSGVEDTDIVSAKKNLQGKAFTSLCYTADGKNILAGGQSKNVCIYNVEEQILLKKFQITINLSLDAVNDFINRRHMTEFGNKNLVEVRGEREGGNATIPLPGVKRGDMAARKFKPEIRVYSLQFSPTGQAWAAVTTEGLLIYSLDSGIVFDPFELDMNVTPEATRDCLYEGNYSQALVMALKLNEKDLIQEVLESVGVSEVDLVVQSLPHEYMLRTLRFVASALEVSPHVEFYLTWVHSFLSHHGPRIHGSEPSIMPLLLILQKSLTRKYEDLSKICDYNKYTLKYLITLGKLKEVKTEDEKEEMEINDVLSD